MELSRINPLFIIIAIIVAIAHAAALSSSSQVVASPTLKRELRSGGDKKTTFHLMELIRGSSEECNKKKRKKKRKKKKKKTSHSDLPPYRNILHIVIDDLGWHDGSWKSSLTPNLNRLAQDGVSLERLYASPMCAPSRASMFTGRHPAALGYYRNPSEDACLPSDCEYLPFHLRSLKNPGIVQKHDDNDDDDVEEEEDRKSSYKTHLVGKWHLPWHSPDELPSGPKVCFHSFFGYLHWGMDYFTHEFPPSVHTGPVTCRGYDLINSTRFRQSKKGDGGGGGGGGGGGRNVHAVDSPGDFLNGIYADELFAQEALRIIKTHSSSEKELIKLKKQRQPLYLCVAFQGLHDPYQAPDKHSGMQHSRSEALPDFSSTDDLCSGITTSSSSGLKDGNKDEFGGYDDDGDMIHKKEELEALTTKCSNYSKMLTKLDDLIGQLVNEIKHQGMYENTIIIVHSDNGGALAWAEDSKLGGASSNYPLRGGKFGLYEGGVRVRGFVHSDLLPESQRNSTWDGLMHISDILDTIVGAATAGGVTITEGRRRREKEEEEEDKDVVGEDQLEEEVAALTATDTSVAMEEMRKGGGGGGGGGGGETRKDGTTVTPSSSSSSNTFNMWPYILSGLKSPRNEIVLQPLNQYWPNANNNRCCCCSDSWLNNPYQPHCGAAYLQWPYKLIVGEPGDHRTSKSGLADRLLEWKQPACHQNDAPVIINIGPKFGSQEIRLFDVDRDPGESINLAHTPKGKRLAMQLVQRLITESASFPAPTVGSDLSAPPKEACEVVRETGNWRPWEPSKFGDHVVVATRTSTTTTTTTKTNKNMIS